MKRTYDLEFGFLIVMGGCVDRSIKTREFDYATLTPDIVLALAREGHFVDISPDTISGRSRASLIGKALVCLQVTWFVSRCTVGKLIGFPLALIEVHTMVHVVCALAMYALWWKAGLSNHWLRIRLMRTLRNRKMFQTHATSIQQPCGARSRLLCVSWHRA